MARRTNAPVEKQSLAEATMTPGQSTDRHKLCEEFYFLLEGNAVMEIDGATRDVSPGVAILIPPGARHQITTKTHLSFLCCCAPPDDHTDAYFD